MTMISTMMKAEKWQKMCVPEEVKLFLAQFLDRCLRLLHIIKIFVVIAIIIIFTVIIIIIIIFMVIIIIICCKLNHFHGLCVYVLVWFVFSCFLYHLAKGSHPAPIVQFLFNCSHSIFLCKFCIILNAFWQHKIDIKRLLRVEMSQIKGKFV